MKPDFSITDVLNQVGRIIENPPIFAYYMIPLAVIFILLKPVERSIPIQNNFSELYGRVNQINQNFVESEFYRSNVLSNSEAFMMLVDNSLINNYKPSRFI